MQGSAVLFSEMTPGPDFEDEFNSWYDQEHIPIRMRAPGFVSAQRYKSTTDARYLAVYEMAATDALRTPQYRDIKEKPSELTRRMLGSVSGFTRYTGFESFRKARGPQAIDAEVLYSVFFNVPAERAAEFDDWYEEDHIPALFKSDDWLMCRRFRIDDGHPAPFTHLALHYLRTADALNSEARRIARESPWRARLAAEPWFNGTYHVFNRLGARQSGFQAASQ